MVAVTESAMPEKPTAAQIADACLWYRHDFGLLDEQRKRDEMYSMREHWRAIWKACHTPGRGGSLAPPEFSDRQDSTQGLSEDEGES